MIYKDPITQGKANKNIISFIHGKKGNNSVNVVITTTTTTKGMLCV